MTASRRVIGLGRTLPIVLALFAAVDIGLRLLPAQALAFRAWEVLARYPAPGAALQANGYFSSSRTHGDMVNMLGIKWIRPHQVRYRPETLTSDRYGFRNLDSVVGRGRLTMIAVGSSFTVSLGGSDRETFPAQIAALAGRGVYSVGGMSPSIRAIDTTMQRFGMTGGTVVQELLEINDPVSPETFNRRIPCAAASDHRVRMVCLARWRLMTLAYQSPLAALLQRAWQTVQPLAGYQRLQNGDSIILRPNLLAPSPIPRSTETPVRNLRAWAGGLRARGLRLILVLVPNKESIYGPLLERPSMTVGQSGDYLARLERDVRAAGIEVVNVAPTLRAFAALHLSEHQYVYYPDDTHWNTCGIAVAARAAVAALTKDSLPDPPMVAVPCPAQ